MTEDKREALIDAMLEVPLIRDYDWLGTGSREPSDEEIRREVGDLVDAYEKATADIRESSESEWEYGTGIPSENGKYFWDDEPSEDLAEARKHAAECDAGCVLLRRRKGGDSWERAGEEDQ